MELIGWLDKLYFYFSRDRCCISHEENDRTKQFNIFSDGRFIHQLNILCKYFTLIIVEKVNLVSSVYYHDHYYDFSLTVLVGWEGGTGCYWESTCQGWKPGPVGPKWDSHAACTRPGGHRLGLGGNASGTGSTALPACRHCQGLVSHYWWLVRCCLRPSPNHWGPRMGRHCRWELELICETEWHSNSMKMYFICSK